MNGVIGCVTAVEGDSCCLKMRQGISRLVAQAGLLSRFLSMIFKYSRVRLGLVDTKLVSAKSLSTFERTAITLVSFFKKKVHQTLV